MNQLHEVAVDETGNPLTLNEWKIDENTGERTMYSRVQSIPICESHSFNKAHECVRCPYVFVGFKSHKHIQKDDGIYDRESGNKIA